MFYLNLYSNRTISASNRATHEAACRRIQQQPHPQSNQIYASHSPPSNQIQSRPSAPIKEDLRVKLVSCPNCGTKVPEKDLQDHQNTSCTSQQIPCEFCNQLFPLNLYASHEELCSMNPNNLGTSVENVKVPCEFCDRPINANLYEKHAQECRRQQNRPQQQGGQPNLQGHSSPNRSNQSGK